MKGKPSGENLLTTSLRATIVETVVTSQSWFFSSSPILSPAASTKVAVSKRHVLHPIVGAVNSLQELSENILHLPAGRLPGLQWVCSGIQHLYHWCVPEERKRAGRLIKERIKSSVCHYPWIHLSLPLFPPSFPPRNSPASSHSLCFTAFPHQDLQGGYCCLQTTTTTTHYLQWWPGCAERQVAPCDCCNAHCTIGTQIPSTQWLNRFELPVCYTLPGTKQWASNTNPTFLFFTCEAKSLKDCKERITKMNW